MTEDEFVNQQGQTQQTGRANPAAQKWADQLTAAYDQLSVQDPVFGELRNLMDLSVVAALFQKHGLMEEAGLSLPLLTDPRSELKIADFWHAPKVVPPQCSFLRTAAGWIVTASGGVQIDSWSVASTTQIVPEITSLHSKAAPQRNRWWW